MSDLSDSDRIQLERLLFGARERLDTCRTALLGMRLDAARLEEEAQTRAAEHESKDVALFGKHHVKRSLASVQENIIRMEHMVAQFEALVDEAERRLRAL
ncbi:hypothetical protein [Salinarimonas rosea]|uniref:hypothetical protein n=1 Tax=Salinarimonas rosea TaxID=552063 RepID=UPI00048D4380|nr:hypothetical protein [Salinarimonas rosea]